MKVSVVSHSHWDREWYKPFQYFNVRLTYFFDKLFNLLENDPGYIFMLDGQMVMIEDYLKLHPENKEKFNKYVQLKQLIIGPFYTQPDEFYPDGESLIRNLLIGTHLAKAFGDYMKIGYLPDAFGHSSQLPHILKASGIHYACVMRGVPLDQIHQDQFMWEGINGDQVMTLALFKGYSNGMFMPSDQKHFNMRVLKEIKDYTKYFNQDHMIIMDGVDHQLPKQYTHKFIEEFSHEDISIKQTTLEDYFKSNDLKTCDLVKGELITPVTHRVHTSMASTRMKQKQKNRLAQQILEKKIEPISTLAWLNGLTYPKQLINEAWKTLMKNQIHDSICGCCTDEVHQEIDQRYNEIKQITKALGDAQSRALSYKITGDKPSLMIFNDTLTKGIQVIHAKVYSESGDFDLIDQDGKAIAYVINDIKDIDAASLSIWSLYISKPYIIKQYDITFMLDFKCDYGYKILSMNHEHKNHFSYQEIVEEKTIENQYHRILFNQDGTFDLEDKIHGHTYKRLHKIEDVADEGDTYNFSPIKNEDVYQIHQISQYKLNIVKDTLRTVATINYDLSVPKQLLKNNKRSKIQVKQHVTYTLTLYENIERIDITLNIDNKAFDHRMRILFPLGYEVDASYAQTQFGTIKRNVNIKSNPNWTETMLPIYAQQKFVHVHNEQHGLTILNKDLTEYEIYKNPDQVAITLFRGVGYLGKANLNIRPGRPSGMPIETPNAQSLGSNEAHYSILTHHHFDEAVISMEAEKVASPLTITQNYVPMSHIFEQNEAFFKLYEIESLQSYMKDELNEMNPYDFSFIHVYSEKLMISAIKKTENDHMLLIRFYNPTHEVLENIDVNLGYQIEDITQCDLLENDLDSNISYHQQTFTIKQVNTYSTITYKLKMKVSEANVN
jgi:mannosylglycerate hydrolase